MNAVYNPCVRFLSLTLLSVLALPALVPAQHALLLRNGDLAAVPMPGASLRAVVDKVCAGPDAAEQTAGLGSMVPRDTRVLDLQVNSGRCALTLSREFLAVIRGGGVEQAIEQLAKTVFQSDASIHAVDLFVEDTNGQIDTLDAVLERLRPLPPVTHTPDENALDLVPGLDSPPQVTGALSGRTIVVSPGHGYYWHSSLGWTTQRGVIDGTVEDLHTNEICLRYLIPYLENMGARVISCRERSEIPVDRVADNDSGAPGYVETGPWFTSSSNGYNGGSYRYATAGPAGGATATWTLPITRDGRYPVYAWYRAGTNRAPDARFEIEHVGGTDVASIDQRRDGLTWMFLGEFEFSVAQGARITLSNQTQSTGGVVIADAIRIGGGYGSIVRGSGTSGQLRWKECSRYWAQFNGAPSSVWDSIAGGQDNDDDVTCRPRFAEWRGADAFVSLHTNAGGGAGTSTYIYNGGASAGSSTLQDRIQSQIIADVRSEYAAGWVDRGKPQANFGEVRLLSTMPGVLIELAFHDTPGSLDLNALHDPIFRRIAARAIARGVLHYFSLAAQFPPEPPTLFRVTQDGQHGLHLAWQPVTGATGYTIEQSPDGKGFVEVASTTQTTWSTGPLPFGTVLSFRVRAQNGSGRSFPTEVLTAGTSHSLSAELLLVQGFDRLGRTVTYPDNTFDYLARHGRAIHDAGEFSLAFDATSNEAVKSGLVPLANYRCIDWACGEESTADDTFDSLEQFLVSAYLQAGGRLLVSGSEIGWDLDAQGSTSDRAFFHNLLGAVYSADDANTYGFRPSAGAGVFSGLPIGTFDNGTQGTYDVDYPDVLLPADAMSTRCMDYSNGLGAGIQRIQGDSRVVLLGFPIETITSDSLRSQVMTRALRFLLEPRALQAPATAAVGTSAPITVDVPASPQTVYLLLAALSTEPATTLPTGDVLPLAADPILESSLDPSNPLFVGFQGVTDTGGHANAAFVVPNLPFLVGIDVYFSGLVLPQISPPIVSRVLPWVRIGIR